MGFTFEAYKRRTSARGGSSVGSGITKNRREPFIPRPMTDNELQEYILKGDYNELFSTYVSRKKDTKQ
jgi:hypothetical protein